MDIDVSKGPALEELVELQAERCKTLQEIAEKSLYFFVDTIEYDENAVKKHLRPVVLAPLSHIYDQLSQLDAWQPDALQACINDTCAAFDMSMGKIAQPLRVAVTGSGMSPSIDRTLTLIGRQRCLVRLKQAIEIIERRIG